MSITTFIEAVIIIYIIAVGWFYFKQDELIFDPEGTPSGTTKKCSILDSFTEIDADGTSIYLKRRSSTDIIIYYHGNTGTVCHLEELFDLLEQGNYSIALVEYETYKSDSVTQPSVKLLKADVSNVINWLSSSSFNKVVLTGSSIGTAFTTYHAAQQPDVSGVVLFASFTSLTDLIKDRRPWLPVQYLLKKENKISNQANLQNFTNPVLILHGANDSTVPYNLGKALAKAVEATFVKIPGTDHTGIHVNAKAVREYRNFVLDL